MKAPRTLATLLLCLALLLSTALAETGDMALMMEGVNTENYPVSTEPLTFTACMANDYIVGDPNETMPIMQLFNKVTGVKFDWTVISTTDLDTQKSLILAGDELPDVSFGVFNDKDVLAYGPLGVFLPYEKYIDECMPNLKRVTTELAPTLLKSLTFSDGHIYTLPKVGAPNVPTTTAIFYNSEWLNQLGMSEPTTTDELFDLLSAIKAHAGEGTIPENVIPFSWSVANKGWTTGQLNAAFDVTLDVFIKDGVVSYSPYMDGWKDMVVYLNKCWEAGLMDPELFTQDNATFVAKGREGLYGAVQGYSRALFLRGAV